MFFETKHHAQITDLYLWLAKAPNGPSVKFHLQNLHTMDELKMTGNCLKGSRGILSFGEEFDSEPWLQLLKELFTQVRGGCRETIEAPANQQTYLDIRRSYFIPSH